MQFSSRYKSLKYIFLALLTAVLAAAVALCFSCANARARADSENSMRALRLCSERSEGFVKTIEDAKAKVSLAALTLGKAGKVSDESLSELQSECLELSGFLQLVSVEPDGKAHTSDGQSVDISQTDEFKQSMSGLTGVSFFSATPFLSGSAVAVYAPVFIDGGISGSVMGFISPDAFFSSNDEGMGVTAVFQPDGAVVADWNAVLLSGRSVWQLIPQEAADELRRAVSYGETGSARFAAGGLEYSACYAPSGVNDWYCLCITRNTAVDSGGEIAALLAGLAVLLAALCFALVRRSDRELERLSSELSFAGAERELSFIRTEKDGMPTDFTKGLQKLTGLDRGALAAALANSPESFISKDTAASGADTKGEAVCRRIKSADSWAWVSERLLIERNGARFLALTDITEKKRRESELGLIVQSLKATLCPGADADVFVYEFSAGGIRFLTEGGSRFAFLSGLDGLPQSIRNVKQLSRESADALITALVSVKNGERSAGCVIQQNDSKGGTGRLRVCLTAVFEDDVPVRAIGVISNAPDHPTAKQKVLNSAKNSAQGTLFALDADLRRDTVVRFEFGDSAFQSEAVIFSEYTTAVSRIAHPDDRDAFSRALDVDRLLNEYTAGTREKSLVCRAKLSGSSGWPAILISCHMFEEAQSGAVMCCVSARKK